MYIIIYIKFDINFTQGINFVTCTEYYSNEINSFKGPLTAFRENRHHLFR